MNDMDVSGLDRAHLEESLHDAEQRFINSGQNIQKLDQQIKELEILYKRAQRLKKNACRYNIRLKLSVLSGIKMMYFHYNANIRDRINRLRKELYGDEYQLGNHRNQQQI